jgi:flagellin FlaB
MKKMRNIKRILKEDDLGDMGIGAMIVFIAMVLVAGIAASVLIQTANRLEIQAMKTGQDTTRQVSTGLAIQDIEGQAAGGVITEMTITVRERAGSGDIDLSQTVIEVTDGTTKTLLTYDSALTQFARINETATPEVFDSALWTGWALDSEHFGILVLQDADTSMSTDHPVLNQGDLAMLCINTAVCFAPGVSPRIDVMGLVSPEQGAPGIFAFRVPSSLTTTVYDLY